MAQRRCAESWRALSAILGLPKHLSLRPHSPAPARHGALTRRGLWRYLRSFLVALLALASLPDDVDDPGDAPVDVHDDADDAAVHLAATIFDDAGCDDLIAFDDFADWYTDGGFKLASWLELLDLSKWVL